MKMSTLSSLFVLLSVVSLIAIAPSAFAAHHEVTITNAPGSATPGCEDTNSCFIPNPITVELGTIVTWDNTDTAAHTASAGTAADGPSGVWDSSLIMAGASFSYTTDTVGSFDYFCMVHPWMAGTLIVEEAGAADAAAADAAAAAEAAAAEAA
ncbi:MAG: plastocyanin/azurin family copper-binding protein, partial [Candidatus Nitrosopelagicus sp.]|nr:plastocyanin/azurin family copper-binding protein [Candidatus Nitrosopelagicus sp.]